METYLVTGGAGFIGSNFIKFLFKKHGDSIFVINVDKLTYAGNLGNLEEIEDNKNYQFVKADICDENKINGIFSQYNIDYVINFAAESHVDRSIEDPSIFVKTNVLGTQVLLNTAKNAWETSKGFAEGKKYIQISTDEVYGELGATGYFTEDTPLNPHSPYSASKAAADLLVKSYYDTYGFPCNITRCSNNYGEYQFPEKLIPLMINNALNHVEMPVYGDGRQIRDWLYVKDHNIAVEMVLRNSKCGEVYNIGSQNEYENIFIVKKVIEVLNREIGDQSINTNLITYVEDRLGHDRRYAIDSSKIKKNLGWKPTITFDDGIERTIKWYIANSEWLNNVTSGEYTKYYKQMYGNK